MKANFYLFFPFKKLMFLFNFFMWAARVQFVQIQL